MSAPRVLRPAVLAAALAALLAGGCKTDTTLVGQCTSDDQCSPHYHCGQDGGPFAGHCLCSDNSVCSQDAGPTFCNAEGLCQTQVGCSSNLDCPVGLFCDTVAGNCVKQPACGSDADCSLGQICDPNQRLCVPGCHSNGDCGIDVPCVCSNGAECQCPPNDGGFIDPATFDRSSCEVGTCMPNTCAGDTSLCPYNQDCVSGGDAGPSTCQPDPRSSVLCQDCVGQVAGGACGRPGSEGANFCLIDPHGSNLFCGVDCSQGQSCPSGYSCQDVIILTQNLCSASSGCAPSAVTCNPQGLPDGGNGCPNSSVCVGSGLSGHCVGTCQVNEGDTQGFCTCVTDSDCPKDTCDSVSRRCNISQQPCDPHNPATCSSVISCVDFGGGSGCFIGRNCAPGMGLHCPLNAMQ